MWKGSSSTVAISQAAGQTIPCNPKDLFVWNLFFAFGVQPLGMVGPKQHPNFFLGVWRYHDGNYKGLHAPTPWVKVSHSFRLMVLQLPRFSPCITLHPQVYIMQNIRIHVRTHTHTHIHTYTHTHTYTYIHKYRHTYILHVTYICIYVYM